MPDIKWSLLLSMLFSLLFMAGLKATAQDILLNRKISIQFSHTTVEQALIQLTTESKITLSFDPTLLKGDKKVTKKFANTKLSVILDDLLEGTQVTYQYLEREIILVPATIKNITVSGHVQDAETGEIIIGVNLYIPALKRSVSSNNYGFYSLTVPASNNEIWISHISYTAKKIMINTGQVSQNTDILLDKRLNYLPEVRIKKDSTDAAEQDFAGPSLDWDLLKKMPYYKEEPDVIKALQMQNGMVSLTERSSNLFVRGGNRDQNLILLDEAIVYNPAHLLGLVSIFNPDALKNVQVYNDDMPASFGGRLSSVIDARMIDGDDKAFHIKGGASLLSARLSAEGPIIKEKASFLLTARKSFSNILNKDFDLFTLAPAYYDLNLKVNYRLSASDRLFYSAYMGNDQLRSSRGYLNTWGNQTSTLRWNHLVNPRLFFNLSAIYSHYSNRLNIDVDSVAGMDKWVTGIKDATLKGDFIFYVKPGSQLQFGFNSILHLFIPGDATNADDLSIPWAKAGEYAAYLSQRLIIGKRVRLQYGLRASFFQNMPSSRLSSLDEGFNPTDQQMELRGGYAKYFRVEPRLMFQYRLPGHSCLQFTYNRNYQYLQLVQNDELAFSSLETWIPSSPNLKPQQADQVSLSYKKESRDYTFAVNTYYKKMLNQLELIDHAQIILNPGVEDQLRSGRADAYGTELMISKDRGRFRYTFLYTWSRAFRHIEEINHGSRYPANYDIPQALKVSLNYQITGRLLWSTFFTYTSGRPVTQPTGYFLQQGIKVPIYQDRNSSRLPDYHRMDVSLTWDLNRALPRQKRPWTSSLSAGLYNLYGKKNALFYKINQDLAAGNLIEKQAFSGLTPSLTYNFKF